MEMKADQGVQGPNPGPAGEATLTKGADQGHEGREAGRVGPGQGAASSGLTAEERANAGPAYCPTQEGPNEKRRKLLEAFKTWDQMEVNELHAEEGEDEDPEIFDGKTGEMLDPELVTKARAEEHELTQKIDLFDEVPASECWDRTGRPPVSTKLVDVDKGTACSS